MPNDPLRSFDPRRYLIQSLASGVLWLIDTKIAAADEQAQAADAEGEYLRRLRAMIAPLAPSLASTAEAEEDDDEPLMPGASEDGRAMLASTALDALAEGDTLAFMRAAMAYDSRIDFGAARAHANAPQPEPAPRASAPSTPQPEAPTDTARVVDPNAPTDPAPPKPSP